MLEVTAKIRRMNENHKVDTMGRAAQEEGAAGTKAHTLKRKVSKSFIFLYIN